MQCPTPISIKDKSENNPHKLNSVRMSVPCGRCGICQKNRRSQWTFRLREELKVSYNCHFVTLTYSDDKLYDDPETGEISLNKKHFQDFIKRVREYDYRKTSTRYLRYYGVGEYGSQTERPHYHAILFNLSQHSYNNLPTIWGYGNTHIGTVTQASIHYVTKYHVNRRYQDGETKQPEFSLMSQGLGKNYIKENKKYHQETGNQFVYMDGYRIAIPRYYKQKIWTESEIKLYSQRNLDQLTQAEELEAERLQKIGHEDPFKEMWRRNFYKSKNIKHKSQDKDVL